MTNLTFRVNKSSTDSSYAISPANFVDVASADTLIFSAGSDVVKNGEPIPSQADYNRAATLLDPLLETFIAHYFLADVSANLLREMFLAGCQNKQFTFCCSFDGATATEPLLEAWDNTDLNSYNLRCLGLSVANDSWFHAKCTTTNPPGSSWTGVSLAGSNGSNIVYLNDGLGALTVAKDLYFNFYVKIPAGVSVPESYLPVLLITFDTN
jgi:hypothetical protein